MKPPQNPTRDLVNDTILEIAKMRPIKEMQAIIFTELGSFYDPVLQEIRQRISKIVPIRGLLSLMIKKESIQVCVDRLKLARHSDPLSADRYSTDLENWKQVFGFSESPEELFLREVTTGLLNVHLAVIDKERDGLEIIELYDRLIGLMLDDETILKTVLRLQNDSKSLFDLKFDECLALKDRSKFDVASMANLACSGYNKRFVFLVDMHALLDILGCSLIRIEHISKSILKMQRHLIVKCMG